MVNVASISSFIAQPAFVPYSTSKGATTDRAEVQVWGSVGRAADQAVALSFDTTMLQRRHGNVMLLVPYSTSKAARAGAGSVGGAGCVGVEPSSFILWW